MTNVIDLPSPPAYETGEAAAVFTGDVAVVSLPNGAKIAGQLLDFDRENAMVRILAKGRNTPFDIPLHAIQAMHLPSPKEIHSASAAEIRERTIQFEIYFSNGKHLSGDTLGYHQDANGLHLFPTYGVNKFMRSFVPFHAMNEYLLGEDRFYVEEEQHQTNTVDNPFQISNIEEFLKTKTITNADELETMLAKQKTMPNMKLGEILVGEQLISEEQLEEALQEQQENKGIPLGQLLINKELVTPAEIQKSLAKKLGIPFVDLKQFEITPETIQLVDKEIAEKHTVVPIHKMGEKLVVALVNPMDWDALDTLRFNTGMNIEPVMATEENIRWAIGFYYQNTVFEDESIEDLTDAEIELGDGDDDSGSRETEEITDNVVVKLLNKIIIDAKEQNVSDIHIEPKPGKAKTVVRFRKDGSLRVYHEIPPQYKSSLISSIKILARLDISEKRRPQDGKIEFKKLAGRKLELRVATVPTVNGQEDVVMRILASGKPIPLEKLGLSERNYDELVKAVRKPYGLFLVCGPTGSGKTTSLHSVLGFLNTPERKIWTAEDPVEITQDGLRQLQVNSKIGVTFATAMRSFLRADPDVIMVGEMRDQETVQIGIEASLTGHLVFSTLHTNSAPESVIRLLDMGMDPFNFADALLGILAQRLAKRLCSECKEAYHPDDDEIRHLVLEYAQESLRTLDSDAEKQQFLKNTLQRWREKFGQNGRFTLYRSVGCPRCDDTGYSGRIGLHELLIGTDAVKKDILNHAPVSKLLETCLREGMTTLRQDGIEKVLQGHTDIHQIRAVCAK